MDKGITGDLGITIGMDVSDRFTEAFAVDDHGARRASGCNEVIGLQKGPKNSDRTLH